MSIYQKIANIQDKILNIPKDGKNPHFSNTYATYEQVMEILHPYLKAEKLMVCHGFDAVSKEGYVPVTTYIVDLEAKDERLFTTLDIPMTKNDPQMAGSAITYAKRYSVLAMFGLGTEDDDGERATTSPKPATAPKVEENAIDTDLSVNCRLHGDPMVQKFSEKKQKYYWVHKMPSGDLCFGN